MKNYFYLILISIVFISCRKEFDFKNNIEQKQISVSCFLKAGDTVRLTVSYTPDTIVALNFIPEQFAIKNAEVYLFKDNVFKEKLSYKYYPPNYYEYGWYYSRNFIPKEGHEYEVKVVVPGYDTIYAQTYIPQKTLIDSIIVNSFITDDFGSKYNISVMFKDDYYETNYYLINSNYIYTSQDPIIEPKINNVFSSGRYNIERNAYFSDRNINGENYGLNIDIYSNPEGANKIYLYSLSKDAYLFYKSSYLQYSTKDNPLSEPVVIYSNVVNGTGVFAGMSSDVDSIILNKNQIK